MPPGAPPVVGKDTVVQALSDGGDYNITQESEGLFISETLAVDRITVRGTDDSTTDNASGGVSLKGVDVYRRDADGTWKRLITIWNHQA